MNYNVFFDENYLLIVDDLPIKKGDYYLLGSELYHSVKDHVELDECKKVIAHLPIRLRVLLENVPLLPMVEGQEPDLYDFYKKDELNIKTDGEKSFVAYVRGYNRAIKYHGIEVNLKIPVDFNLESIDTSQSPAKWIGEWVY